MLSNPPTRCAGGFPSRCTRRRRVSYHVCGQTTRTLLRIFLPLLLAVSLPAWGGGFDYRVLSGEWAAYESKMFRGSWYQYLRVSEKSEGVFAYSYGDPVPVVFHFGAKDVRFVDGVALITLRREGWPEWQLVLSAYRSDDKSSGLATGTLYMFRDKSGTPVLFNSPFVRLQPLEQDAKLQAQPEIKKLRVQ